MRLNRRSLSFSGLALAMLALVFAACTDDGGSPVGPPTPPVVAPPFNVGDMIPVQCRFTAATKQVECSDPDPSTGGARATLIGGQNDNLRLISGPTSIVGDTLAFDVQIQNLLDQPDSADGRRQVMGLDSLGATGPIRIFFHQGPVATGPGGGSVEPVNPDGMETFTGGNQKYFEYNAQLDSGQTSSPKTWKLQFAPAGVNFTFLLYVETPVRLPQGWVNVEPDTIRLATGSSATLTGTPVGFAGKVQVGKPVFWSSLNPAVATVNASGEVTGAGVGTTTIQATTATPGQTGDAVVIVSGTPVAQQDTFDAITNVTAPVPAPGLLEKVDDPDNDATVVAGTFATVSGGTVTLAENGSFTYLGAPGFSGQDQFAYQVTDGVTTLNLTAIVNVAASSYWFVKAGAPAGGDGRDAKPFSTVTQAQAAAVGPGPNDVILLLNAGSTRLEELVQLEAGQQLIGEGIPAAITVALNGVTVTVLGTAGAPGINRPTSGAAVQLATDNTIRGVAIDADAGAGITGSGFGTLTVSDVTVEPAGPALHLTNGTLAASFTKLSSAGSTAQGLFLSGVAGTLTAASGSIRNATGTAFEVTGGSVDVTYPGVIANTAGLAVSLANRTGGTVTLADSIVDGGSGISVAGNSGGTASFSGVLALTGLGIGITGNTGGTVAFTGASKSISTGANAGVTLATNTGATVQFGGGNLAVTTTSGAGFTASGGGTVTVTGAGNTVNTTTGTPVSLDGVGTGAAGTGITFATVNANGAANGIKLNALTGAGFQVTGTGAAGTGGTIANPTGHGVHLTSLGTTPVVLTELAVTGAGTGGNAGISTAAVGNLAVTGVSVGANGGPALSLATTTLNGSFANLTSTASTTSGVILNTVDGAVLTSAGTLSGAGATTVAVVGGAIDFIYQGTVSQANNAALLSVTSTHTGDLSFQGTVEATNGTGLQFNDADGSYAFGGTTTLNGGAAGIDVLGGSTGTFTFAATTSITNPSTGPALNVSTGAPTIAYAGTVTNNLGRAVAVDGITGGSVTVSGAVSSAGAAATGILVANNTGGTIEFTGAKTLSTAGNDAVTLTGNAEAATVRFSGGGLVLGTTTGTAFNVNGGGTLSVTGAGNTATATAGVGVRILSTKIDGTGGVVFQSVNASGGANGILLQNTTTGTFGVTGTGAPGSGGTIQNTTGAGVNLLSTAAATLNGMNLSAGSGGAQSAALRGGIFGTLSVTGTSVTAGGGPALQLSTGTLNGTFSSVGGTVAPAALKGVDLSAVAGSFTVSGGRLASTDSLMVVRGGTVSASWQGKLAQTGASAAPLLVVMGNHATGTLAFADSVIGQTGTGLQFNDADGTYNFNGVVLLQGGDAAVDITNGSAGTFDFSTSSFVTSPTGTAFSVQGSSPNVTYRGSLTKANAGLLVDIAEQPGGTVTFQTNNLLATAGDGVRLSNADGTVNLVGSLNLAGGNAGVDILNGSSGTITVSPAVGASQNITNPTGTALFISGGAPTVTVGAVIGTNASRPIEIENLTGGSVTVTSDFASSGASANGVRIQGNTGAAIALNGAQKILSTGANTAVSMVSNTGSTISFGGGGLAITTTTGAGFSATGGGTVTVTGANNTVASAGGTAVNIQNTTLGGTSAFRSVSANGGTNGIVLNNTGAGGFQVTGNGSAGTGGTIQNTSGDGARIASANNVSLQWMNFSNIASGVSNAAVCHSADASGCESAVDVSFGSNVTLNRIAINGAGQVGVSAEGTNGLTVTNSTVLNVGDADAESGMILETLAGTSLVQDVTIDNPEEFGVKLYHATGTMGLTLRRVTVQNNVGTFGEAGFQAEVQGGTANVLVDDSDFLNTDGTGVFGTASGSTGAVLNMTVQNSSFSGNLALPSGVNFTTGGTATGRLTATGNNIAGCPAANTCSQGFDIDASINSVMDVTLLNNTISDAGIGTGIELISNEFAVMRARVEGNNVTVRGGRIGMNVQTRSVTTTQNGSLDVTLKSNTINGINTAFVPGIQFQSGNSGATPTHNNSMCVNMATAGSAGANVVNGTVAANVFAYTFRQRTGTTFKLQNYAGSASSTTDAETFVQTNNSGGTLGGATEVFAAGGTGIVNYTGGTCATPTTATLP